MEFLIISSTSLERAELPSKEIHISSVTLQKEFQPRSRHFYSPAHNLPIYLRLNLPVIGGQFIGRTKHNRSLVSTAQFRLFSAVHIQFQVPRMPKYGIWGA